MRSRAIAATTIAITTTMRTIVVSLNGDELPEPPEGGENVIVYAAAPAFT